MPLIYDDVALLQKYENCRDIEKPDLKHVREMEVIGWMHIGKKVKPKKLTAMLTQKGKDLVP